MENEIEYPLHCLFGPLPDGDLWHHPRAEINKPNIRPAAAVHMTLMPACLGLFLPTGQHQSVVLREWY